MEGEVPYEASHRPAFQCCNTELGGNIVCGCVRAGVEAGGTGHEEGEEYIYGPTGSLCPCDMFIMEQKHMLSMITRCLSISYLNIKAH